MACAVNRSDRSPRAHGLDDRQWEALVARRQREHVHLRRTLLGVIIPGAQLHPAVDAEPPRKCVELGAERSVADDEQPHPVEPRHRAHQQVEALDLVKAGERAHHQRALVSGSSGLGCSLVAHTVVDRADAPGQ